MREHYLILAATCCFLALITTVPAASAQSVGGDMGTYLVHGNVDGASVTFDSTFKGYIDQGVLAVPVYVTGTPYKTFSVSKVGYETYTGPVLVVPQAGQTIDLYATMNVIAVQTPGVLNVLTSPPVCEIYQNGVKIGVSDVSGVFIQSPAVPGTYTIEVKKNGYETGSKVVTIPSDAVAKVSFTLAPITMGSIGVTSTPPGANVYLDDVYKGVSPLTIQGVSAGEHRMVVRASGYQDMTIMVTVVAGQNTPVTVALTAIPPSSTTPAPTKSPLPAVLAVVASTGAVALFVVSRRRN
jgi:hypothetical protein